jgi:hypothetical protein
MSDNDSNGTERFPDCSYAAGHKWETVDVAVKGRGSGTTYVVMQCSLCLDLMIDHDPEVVAEVGRDV